MGVEGAGRTDQVQTLIGRTMFVVFQKNIQEALNKSLILGAQIDSAETLTSWAA